MSEKVFEENFWSKIEKDGGFKLGEMRVWCVAGTSGKSTFAHEYLLDVKRDPTGTHDVEILKARDYNGPQCEFDFTSTEILPND